MSDVPPRRKYRTPKGGRPRGQNGWLEEVSRGKWQAHWYVYTKLGDSQVDERRHRSFVLGKMSKTDAKTELAKIVARECGQAGSNPFGDSRSTFAWFWEHNFVPLKKPRWGKQTRRQVASLFKCHIEPRWGAERLADIKGPQLATWLEECALTLKEWTLKHIRKHMRAAFAEAVEQDFLRKNPMRSVQMPLDAVGPSTPVLTIPQLIKVRQSIQTGWADRDVAMFDVLVVTGVRPSEMLALKWEYFNGAALFINQGFVAGELKKTKTKKSRAWVAIPKKLATKLVAYKKKAPSSIWMFPGKTDKPIALDNWRKRVLQPAAAAVGIEMDARTLRRSLATWGHEFGATLKTVQEQLRHSSSSTTADVYIQPVSGSMKKLVESIGRKYFGR